MIPFLLAHLLLAALALRLPSQGFPFFFSGLLLTTLNSCSDHLFSIFIASFCLAHLSSSPMSAILPLLLLTPFFRASFFLILGWLLTPDFGLTLWTLSSIYTYGNNYLFNYETTSLGCNFNLTWTTGMGLHSHSNRNRTTPLLTLPLLSHCHWGSRLQSYFLTLEILFLNSWNPLS